MSSNAELLKQLRIEKSHREAPARKAGGGKVLAISAIAVLAVAVLGAGGWYVLSHRPIPVHTATAVAAATQPDAGAVLQATGYVTARRQATVSAQITGTLTEVLIEEGDHVRKGQILARLEDNATRASLAAYRASAAAGHAQVAQMQAQLDQASRDADRQDALARRGLVSAQSAEQARTQVTTMRAQLTTARRQAESSDAQVSVADVNLDYTVVRAPFDGVITDKAAQVGEIVSPLSAGGGFTRTGVGTIVDMDSLEVDVDVNEAYIGRVKPGMSAETVLDAYPDWNIPAHVIAIVPAADRGKATVKVRVALENKDGRIVPDMGARVSFLEHRTEQTSIPRGVLIPASAVISHDGHDSVFVMADGHARRRDVRPAKQAYGDLRLIPDGISTGDIVVLSPPANLDDGSSVSIQTAP
ncbi:RND family efflux transporter MFP subunit [Luteibacter sp. Sphag1AF]|uniref:efflux RND transporter periplasmic adaptor subunit n=1 Tax=Luteibacter sp. Sphag1AF TaxID=2587031 RepID=UPI001620474C|nr:efflux RND transporter periplasmic adaptor subunit [Luteibacter sp. Sphag1AF]MBB3226089.1 RND family efflux transporter MFP subunit [Luteibacter sp. Sphag1AF]